MRVDFEVVKRDKHQDLLTFSIKKTEIQRYLDLLKAVNLRPAVIMPGGYAAARFISAMTADSTDFLFIDSGENNHTIYAVCSGHLRMVRTLPSIRRRYFPRAPKPRCSPPETGHPHCWVCRLKPLTTCGRFPG